MRIAIFGGSFDPVHIEHVRLAYNAVDCLGLDKLIVMPAHTPPHKRGKTLSSDADRLEMCKLAFSCAPHAEEDDGNAENNAEKIEVSDYEISRGGTSYTCLTCRHFKELYPQAELFWIVGTDMLRDFPMWKNPEEILSLASLAVCARNEETGWLEEEKRKFFDRFQKDFYVLTYEGKDVSSTAIRVLAGAGEDVSPFTGKQVAEHIGRKGLYEIPHAKEALALEKPSRKAHSIRVALLAAARAASLKVDENKAITAALFHDCAKNLPKNSPYLEGFICDSQIPAPVIHQFSGAYVAEKIFGVKDREVLDAIAYHTSGKEDMSALGKLIFLADMLESGRNFEGIDELRAAFWRQKDSLDECMLLCLRHMLKYLHENEAPVYALTESAYEYLIKNNKEV